MKATPWSLFRELLTAKGALAEIDDIRRTLFDGFVLACAWVGAFPVALATVVAWQRGRPGWAVAYLGCYLAFLLLVVLPKRMSPTRRAWGMLLSITGIGIITLTRLGLSGAGDILLVASTVAAFVLLGFRSGVIFLVISLLAMALVGTAILLRWVEIEQDLLLTSLRPTSWVSAMLVFTVVAAAIIGALQIILMRLSAVIAQKDESRAALEASESRFRQLTELLPETVFETDLEGRVTFANRAGLTLFGFEQSDLGSISLFNLLPPEEIPRVAADIEQVVLEGVSKVNEYVAKRRDGTEFSCLVKTNLIEKDGQPTGLRGVLLDITDRKSLEEQLRQAQKLQAIGTLAGGVAHDFNNILMGIQGRAELIGISEPNLKVSEHVLEIHRCVSSATDLVRQLLGFARGGKYELTATDLNELVGGTTKMFARTHRDLEVRLLPCEHPVVASVDRAQIEQVFLNLYLNAWQAMPEGGTIEVTVESLHLELSSVRLELPSGDYARVCVTDTGAGLDEASLSRVFDPFYTTKEKGTGLGLASAYGIVKNHGGAISAENSPDGGAIFSVVLPVSSMAVEENSPKTVGPDVRGSGLVLLVDDEEIVATVAMEMLSLLGYEVLVAADAKACFEHVTNRPDEISLIILDMIMPGSRVREVVDTIRQHCPEVPILLSSGYTMGETTAELLEETCQGFIQKPYGISDLSQKIATVLKRD